MIKPELLNVKITMYNREYYRSLGYDLHDGRGQHIEVCSTKIKPDSCIKVIRVCDICSDEAILSRDKVKSLCFKCAMVKRNGALKDPSKTTCPKCGETKSYRAKVCVNCRSMAGKNNPMFGKTNEGLALRNRNRNPEDHWNWKGGHDNKRDSKTIAWAKHVKKVGKCDYCDYSNPLALDAHHLESYKDNEALRYDVRNGVCLCKNCHTVFHKTYGFGSNTKEQYLEFKEAYRGSN